MVPPGCKLKLICPAKINLSLAVLGRQPDGFHALHSVVAQTEFGDVLDYEWNPASSFPDQVSIQNLELDPRHSSLHHALAAFREAADMRTGQFVLHLEKKIPVGAGLGGGSSNAAAVLKAVRETFTRASAGLDWRGLAAAIGSDCPLFMEENPVVMEGRGDRITPLPEPLACRIRGKPVILFKPGFSINTAEAYSRLAGRGYYQSPVKPLERMAVWINGTACLPPSSNDFERMVADWMPSLSVVLERLRRQHGLDVRLSGSGSACFLFPNDPVFAIRVLRNELKNAWGRSFWIQETFVK